MDDAREYEKAELEARYRESVAELAFGEDADALGGLTLDRSFARSSDTVACGKAEVLLRLLAVWAAENRSEGAGNKARARKGLCDPCGVRQWYAASDHSNVPPRITARRVLAQPMRNGPHEFNSYCSRGSESNPLWTAELYAAVSVLEHARFQCASVAACTCKCADDCH